MELKANLVDYLETEEDLNKFLHPRKRSVFELLKLLYKPIFKDKVLLGMHIGYGVSGGLIFLLSAFIVKFLIDSIEKIARGDVTFESAKPIFLIGIGYGVIFILLNIIFQNLSFRKFSYFMTIRLFKLVELLEKKSNMDLGLLEDARVLNSFGNLTSPVESTNAGMEGIYHRVFGSLNYLFAFIFFSIILAFINPIIPLFALLGIYVGSISEKKYTEYRNSLISEFEKINRKSSSLNTMASDFTYGKDLRIFRMQKVFKILLHRLFKSDEELTNDLQKIKIKWAIPKALTYSTLEVGLFVLVFLGFKNNDLDMSTFVMLLTIIGLYISNIKAITETIRYVLGQLVDMNYYYDFLDAETEINGGEDLEVSNFENVDIKFENLWFKYPGSDNYVLKGLNLTIENGQSLALLGLNGAGKTSLISLLSGLYRPNKGRILIGNKDVSNLSQETINKVIAIVLQNFEPIAMPVKENVAVSEDVDRELVEESLEKAGILEKIKSFEKGIDSYMLKVIEDDGLVLSGGENQKIAIARALYKKDAKILVLDEPTSALDAFSEEKIYRDFEDLVKEKTSIFISHRLASTRFCDKIALLNNGVIEEIGTHHDLLKANGLYKKMYDTQASYYKEQEAENEEN